MSSDKETTDYIQLRPGDKVQVGDQWRDQFGQWHFFTHAGSAGGFVNSGVKARRPIPERHQATCEEVPGSRTTQKTIVNSQRERIAHEDLQPGDIIQEGDEWQNECGRWRPFIVLHGSRVQVRQSQRVRRPYKISTILEIGDALANAQKAATQLQDERNEFQTALIESRLSLKRKVAEVMEVCKERDEACRERDLARAEVARLSTELWARKPLEDRVASLTEELAQARAELQRLQEVAGNLYNEPTAKQVQQMLRTWATELDWSAGCFDSVGRDEIDTIQRTLIAVVERIETMLNPEGGSDDT